MRYTMISRQLGINVTLCGKVGLSTKLGVFFSVIFVIIEPHELF